ncbi:MAG TPA: serpin family protein [Jiangellaceae bacterium]
MDRQHLEYALALHDALPPEGNLPWSPYSVASALGLAASGARGRTRDELIAVLARSGSLDALGRLLSDAARLADAEAAVANTLWMRIGLDVHDDFKQAVLAWPGGAVRAADFEHDAEGARQKINDDVAQETRGLIKGLLPSGAIHRDIGTVIVNALYLKVAWRNPFEAGRTIPAPFHAPSGTKDVPTMRQQEQFRYATADGWQQVTLPTPSDVVVDVVLPEGREATAPPAATLAALRAESRSRKIDLALPRFRVEATLPLVEPLRTVGIEAAFNSRNADFGGISAAPMYIESAMHKAVLRADEQGFEGAAATALSFRVVSIDMSRPVPFHVDRPFLVVVRHARTGAVYFLARVTEP